MARQVRLEDLYHLGEVVTITGVDPESGEPVEAKVRVRKLTKPDHEIVLRRAGGARATLLAAAKDRDSDLYRLAWGDVHDLDRDALLDLVLAETEREERRSVTARLEMEDGSEWAKDGYLQGLMDAWRDGLAERYAADPSDEEAARVFAELKRFTDTVGRHLDEWRREQTLVWESTGDDALRDRAAEVLVAGRADRAWQDEYERSTVWRACRKTDAPLALYFETRDEVDLLEAWAPDAYALLLATIERITVGVDEGKDLPPTQGSSTSPEQPEPAADSTPSGPAAAVA